MKKYKLTDANIKDSISTILLYSKPDLVKEVLSTVQVDASSAHLDNVDTNRYFNKIVHNPFLFILGKKATKRKNSSSSTVVNRNDIKSGAFNHYKANRDFLIEHGVDLASISDKCCFVLSVANKKVRKLYEIYKSYGFTDQKIFKTISCFDTSKPYSSMDFLIENGCKEHLFKYLCQSVRSVEPYVKYRILLAKKCGVDVTKANAEFNGYISDRNNKSLYYMPEVNIPEEDVHSFLGIVEPISEEDIDQESRSKFDDIANDAVYDPLDKMHDFPYFTYLEETYLSEDRLVYELGIVNVSMRKAIRVYSALKNEFPDKDDRLLLTYAMTKDSILDQEQVNVVKSTVEEVIRKCGASYERTNK